MKTTLPGLAILAVAACSSGAASLPLVGTTCTDGGACSSAPIEGGPPSGDEAASTLDSGSSFDSGATVSDAGATAGDGGGGLNGLPPVGPGIPSLGWGAYYVSTTAHNGSPTIDDFARGAGVPTKSLNVIEDFETGWTTSSSLDYAKGNIAGWAAGAETSPSAGRSFVIGGFPLRATDGSMSEATIVAGKNDAFFQQIVDNWASAGYTRNNGYSGQIFLRMNWEQNYPATTPGNYRSSQTTIKGWTEPGGAAYAEAMIPAWQHAVTVLRGEANAKGVPLQIVWNPTGINSGADEYADPTRMYPGDDYVDVHCTDLYSNSLYPLNSADGKSFTTWPGYWTDGKPFQTGFAVGPAVPLATWWSSYDNIAHFFDFEDATVGDADGKSAFGWGLAKATDYALAQGWYAGAVNPDGSARKAKPLAICESGIIGYGPGPYTTKGKATDPNLMAYFKSRIATIQQRGGTFLFFVLWNGPDSTGISPEMLATVGATFGTSW